MYFWTSDNLLKWSQYKPRVFDKISALSKVWLCKHPVFTYGRRTDIPGDKTNLKCKINSIKWAEQPRKLSPSPSASAAVFYRLNQPFVWADLNQQCQTHWKNTDRLSKTKSRGESAFVPVTIFLTVRLFSDRYKLCGSTGYLDTFGWRTDVCWESVCVSVCSCWETHLISHV